MIPEYVPLGEFLSIFFTELMSKRKSHKTFEDAKKYMIERYLGYGELRYNGLEYTYRSYSYSI